MKCEKLLLVQDGNTKWRIIIGEKPDLPEIHAAEELQVAIQQVSGAVLPVLHDEREASPFEILIGENKHFNKVFRGRGMSVPGGEGYIIVTEGNYLAICGGNPRGTLYGVYDFIENYMGYRWFSSRVAQIPKRNRLEVCVSNQEYIPLLEYREVFYFEAFDGDWSARNRLNGMFHKLRNEHGGKIKYAEPFVHTFDYLLPVKEYFDKHPEYFSEIGGKRISEHTQLCLTNPDVLDILVRKVKGWIKNNPEARIFSVSQNDCYNPCTCENCRELYEKEGSHSGSFLNFVNKVAEQIEAEYPDKLIDTLAYQFTRKPPGTIRPRKNVIIRLCSIECCFSHPMESCDVNREFADDLKAWSKVCDRLYMWDYVTSFANYIMPFPNLGVLKSNIKFLINNNVRGIFEEGNYTDGGGGEFAELRSYLLAKLLWNPDLDTRLIMNEFLLGYYGMAAAPIREYIDLLQNKVEKENIHLNIYDPPTSRFLTEETVSKAERLFELAMLLADDDTILERVKRAGLPVKFARLALGKKDTCRYKELVEDFFREVDRYKISAIRELKPLDYSKSKILDGDFSDGRRRFFK